MKFWSLARAHYESPAKSSKFLASNRKVHHQINITPPRR